MWTHELPTESGLYHIAEKNGQYLNKYTNQITVLSDNTIEWNITRGWMGSLHVTYKDLKEPDPNVQFYKIDSVPDPIW